MKKFILLSLTFIFVSSLFSQTIQEISTGAGYKKQSFVNLAAGTETQVNDNSWDIAFTVFGLQDAGIFINESSGSSMGQSLPGVEAFWTLTDDFSVALDPADLTVDFRLLNDEKSWNYGAFNADRDPTSPFDYGWGKYNPATNSVSGTDVFAVKLRDGSFKKIEIQSLVGTTYKFRYANLDGSDEKTVSINKADHAGKLLAYFSFTTGTTANVEPATGFDLFYCRYITKLFDPGTMTEIDYNVTGILHNRNVTVAKAMNINPATVQYSSYKDSFQTKLDVIGHDWKAFSGVAWSVDDKRVYFVRTANQHVWKLHFIDFEGSTTGTGVFEKTDLGIISGTDDLPTGISGFDIFPNPATTEANILLNLKENAASDARLVLQNLEGKIVFERNIPVQNGLNGFVLPTADFPAGLYFLNLNLGNETVSRKIVKN